MKDLVVLAADKQCEFALRGILSRRHSLGIRDIQTDFLVHPEHDPGCLTSADSLLATLRGQYGYALVVCDREGSGREQESREILERDIENSLQQVGWELERVAAIVIDPELEAWVWSDSPEVDTCLGWSGASDNLREWVADRWEVDDNGKPDRPKEALVAALREVNKARSSSTFKNLAESVGLNRCTDPAFLKLRDTLTTWFPAATS